MAQEYYVKASVRLDRPDDNVREVSKTVTGEFKEVLDLLFSEALALAQNNKGVDGFSILNIRIMPMVNNLKIHVNVLLDAISDEDGEGHKSVIVKFPAENELCKSFDLHRLVAYMKVLAVQEYPSEFKTVVHLRILPSEVGEGRF